MTPERDEMNEQLRQRRIRREQQRKKQKRQNMLQLAAVAAVAIFVAALILWTSGRSNESPETTLQTAQPAEDTGAEILYPEDDGDETQPTEEYTVIHIAAAGDLNVTDKVIAGSAGVSGYRFDDAFLDVAPVLAEADLTLMNFEGTLAGAPYGTATGSAPAELVQALADAGVDVVQTANSATIRSGVLGLQSTISGLENAGLIPLGTFASEDAFKETGGYTIVEVEGIRIALVAFTKGMDNLGLPEGSEDCVNLLYEDYTTDYKTVDTEGITEVLENIEDEDPDLTIAMLHWGSEYNENISDSQKSIRNLMFRNGVDAIIGSHSHLLQAIEYDEEAGTLVAWSMGDFYGNADEPASNYSVILDLEVTLDNATGLTSITDYSVTPIYTLQESQSLQGGHRVVRLEKALARYESLYVGRVTGEAYESMQYALTRIGQRIAGE